MYLRHFAIGMAIKARCPEVPGLLRTSLLVRAEREAGSE
jgi:hypothetical protein